MLRHFTSHCHGPQRAGHGIKESNLYTRGAQQVDLCLRPGGEVIQLVYQDLTQSTQCRCLKNHSRRLLPGLEVDR